GSQQAARGRTPAPPGTATWSSLKLPPVGAGIPWAGGQAGPRDRITRPGAPRSDCRSSAAGRSVAPVPVRVGPEVRLGVEVAALQLVVPHRVDVAVAECNGRPASVEVVRVVVIDVRQAGAGAA